MKPSYLVTLFSLFTFQLLWAESTPEAPPLHTLQFKTLALKTGNYSGIYVQAKPKEDPVLLSFNRYRRSKPVKYEGASPIVFFKLEKTQNPEKPFRKIPVASYKISTENTPEDLLLLFSSKVKESPSDPEYSIFGMDDSSEAFPFNTVIIYNATPLELIGVVNKEKGQFPKGPSKPFALKDHLYAAVAFNSESGPRVLFENTFKFPAECRVLLILHPPKRKGSLRIQCYYVTENMEKPQPPKQEKEIEDGK